MAAKKAGKSKAKAKTPAKRPGGGKAKKTAKKAVKCPRTALKPAKSRTTKQAGKPKQVNKINKGMKQAGKLGGIASPSTKSKKKNPVKTAVPGGQQNKQPAAEKKKAVKRKQAQQNQVPGPTKDPTAKPIGKTKQVKKINDDKIPAGVLGGIASPSSKPKKQNPVKTTVPGPLQNNQPAAPKQKALKRKQTQPRQAAVSNKRRKTDPAAQMNFVERPPIHFSMSSPPIQPPSVFHVHPVEQIQPSFSNPPPIQDLYNNFQREIPSQSQSDSRTTDTESHQIIKDLRHFVDEHRHDLISKINPVEPILDDLLNKELLKQEQYDNCKSKETPQSQMRELFGYVRGWGNPDKDIFLQILEHHNEPIIRGLRE